MTNQYAPKNVMVDMVRVTPTMAREWLSHNTRNREISRKTVLTYAQAMREDNWHFTGEPIIFDEDDVLNNGQHTLAAVAEMQEGYEIDLVVIYGVTALSQQFSDQGRKRTLAHMLTMNGRTKNTTQVAAISKLIFLWDHGIFFADHNGPSAVSATNVSINVWLSEHPAVEDWINEHVYAIRKIVEAPDSALGAALFIIERSSPVVGKEFVDRFLSQNRTDADETLKALDRQLRTFHAGGQNANARDYMGTIFLAWNLWAKGKKRTNLGVPKQIIPEGMRKALPRWTFDTFPRPVEATR